LHHQKARELPWETSLLHRLPGGAEEQLPLPHNIMRRRLCQWLRKSSAVYISVETHLTLSFRAERRNPHLCQGRFLSCRCAQNRQSLALLGMTGEPDPMFPPKTIRYRKGRTGQSHLARWRCNAPALINTAEPSRHDFCYFHGIRQCTQVRCTSRSMQMQLPEKAELRQKQRDSPRRRGSSRG
jgi:hypothetical protein